MARWCRRPPSTGTCARRADHPSTAEAAQVVLQPVRRRTTQRTLAGRLHPLVAGRRHPRRDPQLDRRPRPLRALSHRAPPRHRPIVLDAFRNACAAHGIPASTLTDNGMVFTTRLAGVKGGRNGLENELRRLGVVQINSTPNHPTARSNASTRASRNGSTALVSGLVARQGDQVECPEPAEPAPSRARKSTPPRVTVDVAR